MYSVTGDTQFLHYLPSLLLGENAVLLDTTHHPHDQIRVQLGVSTSGIAIQSTNLYVLATVPCKQ